jgi:hypothetical protein
MSRTIVTVELALHSTGTQGQFIVIDVRRGWVRVVIAKKAGNLAPNLMC